jgi:hypothetical protein
MFWWFDGLDTAEGTVEGTVEDAVSRSAGPLHGLRDPYIKVKFRVTTQHECPTDVLERDSKPVTSLSRVERIVQTDLFLDFQRV